MKHQLLQWRRLGLLTRQRRLRVSTHRESRLSGKLIPKSNHLVLTYGRMNAPVTAQSMLNKKAKYSEPCSRCGTCCALSLCPPAEIAFPERTAPCPALFFEEETAVCGLMLMEKHFLGVELVAKCLGAGHGCTCPDAETTENEVAAFGQHLLHSEASGQVLA